MIYGFTIHAMTDTDRANRPRMTAAGRRHSPRSRRTRFSIRGYPLDEMMGRLSFADAVYLLLMGELPTPAIGRMLNAILVSSIDHGVTPPSTLAARNVATSGAPLKDCVAAGILAFGPHHGGDIESCMRFLDGGLTLMRSGESVQEAAEAIVDDCVEARRGAARIRSPLSHARSPCRAALSDGARARARGRARAADSRGRARARRARSQHFGQPLPVNVDGAIAADLRRSGFRVQLGNAIFLISRTAGPNRARARGAARARRRCGRSIRRITSTTAPRAPSAGAVGSSQTSATASGVTRRSRTSRIRPTSSAPSQRATAIPATPLPIMFVVALAIDMKRSMPESAMPATGTVWTVASVAASVTKVEPDTPATPLDMINITPNNVTICCAVR